MYRNVGTTCDVNDMQCQVDDLRTKMQVVTNKINLNVVEKHILYNEYELLFNECRRIRTVMKKERYPRNISAEPLQCLNSLEYCYRVVLAHRNWQIETEGWNWAGLFTKGLGTRWQRF